nr:phosphoribosylanthranilate isomerase [uncultured Rhodopila sp.]
MIGVKICGINDPAGFDAAVGAGADWIGFVFFPPSPRFVTPHAAASLSARIHGGPLRVGLFVEPAPDVIAEALDRVGLDILQIYGAAEHLPAIRDRFGLPVWRAFGISRPDDLPDDPGLSGALVLEAKPPAEADRPGGNGARFDWRILRGWQAPLPWLLAGGLTPDNVATAIEEAGARAVDVSSGVERTRGVKDPAMIQAFVRAAKAAGISTDRSKRC